MSSGEVGTCLFILYFPFYPTAVFKVLNHLCFKGLQCQDVCLQSKLLTWYLIYLMLLYSILAHKTVNMWSLEDIGGFLKEYFGILTNSLTDKLIYMSFVCV